MVGATPVTTPHPDPDYDPRTGIHIAAGESILGAAALVQGWLYDNTNSPQQRAQFVIELDGLMTDFDFTLGCVKGLAAELPERGL